MDDERVNEQWSGPGNGRGSEHGNGRGRDSRKGPKLSTVVAIWSAAISVLVALALLIMATEKRPDEWSELEAGMTQVDVEELLGQPVRVCTRQEDESAVHCQVKGYPAVFRVGAETAYAYTKEDAVFYIYFDEEGRILGGHKRYK